jgi:putative ABC transport system substrate-binding protein
LRQQRSRSHLDAAFTSLAQKRTDALITGADGVFTSGAEQLVVLAARHAVPMVFAGREAALVGGLMSYSASMTESYRQTGLYAGRILKGEKPADLPVLLPTTFELVINLKTAKALALTIPSGVLAISDEVIE